MTPAATPEALVEALAENMLRHEWPNSPLVPFSEQDERIRNYWLGQAKAQIAGPLAPVLAALATATAEAASLRAEVEAKDRALKAATDKLEAVCNAISVAAEWERAAERSRQREDERLRRNPLIRGAVEAARAATAGEGA